MKSKLLIIIFSIIIAIIFYNIQSNTKKGINYEVIESEIYLHNKIFDFLKRNNELKKRLKTINKLNKEKYRFSETENKILIINKWLYLNLSKLKKNDIIIDYHPTTILHRLKGTSDQFNDLNSIFLVYSKIDSFYKNLKYKNKSYVFTFVKINNYWSVVDPYNGLYFVNDNKLASIEDIKKNNFIVIAMRETGINQNIFYEKKMNQEDIKIKINKIFLKFDKKKEIIYKHKYLRGGRSYFQQPLQRIHYEILKKINLI